MVDEVFKQFDADNSGTIDMEEAKEEKRQAEEAERKAIEATGIADFQKIVAHGIDEKLLRWKGIEATTELEMWKKELAALKSILSEAQL